MANDTMTAPEAARFLGVSEVSLYYLRQRGRGPTWTDTRTLGTKRARPVYDRASVEDWAIKSGTTPKVPGRSDRQRIASLERAVASLRAKVKEARP